MKDLSECKILVVDDTETNIDILVEVLGDEYEISVAMDGISALENVKKEIPDLILLDIMMPNMSGFEVCDYLQADPRTKEIPIIFLTAVTDIESKSKGFQKGAVDYVTKPFEVQEVQARVKTHLMLRLAKLELSMQNVILEEKVKERTKELDLTQETTIEALAVLAEHRDPETGGHILRTKNYVRAVARELKKDPKYHDFLTEKTIDMYYKSAPLHDIGKVGIRDSVLLKPGKLTDEEFTEMKKHPMIGYMAIKNAAKILGENSFLTYSMEFARYHHEKWNGSGYPAGLQGEDIPLPGRIMAIADVYDALISKRVYKPAFSHKKAMLIIQKDSGSHFDPKIVEAFLAIEDEVQQIALDFLDSPEQKDILLQDE